MKTFVLLFSIILFVFSNTIKAENDRPNRKTPVQRTEKIVAEMKEVCKLSEVQTGKVKEIILKREKQKEIDREKFSKDNDAAKKATKERNIIAETGLKNVLTAQQYDSYTNWKKEVRAMKKAAKEAKQNKEDPNAEFIESETE